MKNKISDEIKSNHKKQDKFRFGDIDFSKDVLKLNIDIEVKRIRYTYLNIKKDIPNLSP